jgi:hypothetical protein
MATTASVLLLSNAAATSAAANWPGGKGVFSAKATGYGSVDLQFQLGDNTTWVTPTGGSLTADGGFVFELPPCPIRAAVTGATAVYARADRIPE